MRGREKLDIGDVLTIPIDSARVGIGQVVSRYGRDAYLFAVFDAVLAAGAQFDLDALGQLNVLLMGLSFDAKVAAGDWVVVGRAPVARAVHLPAYREPVGEPGGRVDVVDAPGQRRRAAGPGEAARLHNRVFVAPVRIERALQAHHNLGPWLPDYNELVPHPELAASEYFG